MKWCCTWLWRRVRLLNVDSRRWLFGSTFLVCRAVQCVTNFLLETCTGPLVTSDCIRAMTSAFLYQLLIHFCFIQASCGSRPQGMIAVLARNACFKTQVFDGRLNFVDTKWLATVPYTIVEFTQRSQIEIFAAFWIGIRARSNISFEQLNDTSLRI